MFLPTVALIALASVGTHGDRSTVRFSAPSSASSVIRLSLDADRRWPAPTTITLRNLDDNQVLAAVLSARGAAELRRIVVPTGHYRLEIRAAHHSLAVREVSASPNSGAALGEIALNALSMVRGSVTFRGKPLREASIATSQGVIGTTRADGTFEVELPERRPPQLRISRPSLGTKFVPLPRQTADLALLPIEMLRSASFEVRVAGASGPVDLIMRHGEDEGDEIDIAKRRLASPSSAASFNDLDPGVYTLVTMGVDPLARHATRLRIDEGEKRALTVRLHPRRIEGTVRWGTQSLPNVTLQFRNADFGWSSRFNADHDGRFASELWQTGNFNIGIWRGGLHNLYATEMMVDGGAITLSVPIRKIGGRVVDIAAERGVAGARVYLRVEDGASTSTLTQTTDSNGSFLFDALPAARGVLTVSAENYLIPDPTEITSGEGASSPEVVIKLDAGRGWSARVFDHQGRPMQDVQLMAVSGNRVRATARTDLGGRTTLPVPINPVVVYVLAPKGGIAVVDRFESDRIEMPAPISSLRLTTQSTVGDRMPPMSFLMSVNGWMIPPVVAEHMARYQGVALRTDESGALDLTSIAPGLYQFWPYGNSAEAEAIFTAPPEAPISISVKSGPNVVAIDFQQMSAAFAHPPE
jgi:hypothetical protein